MLRNCAEYVKCLIIRLNIGLVFIVVSYPGSIFALQKNEKIWICYLIF